MCGIYAMIGAEAPTKVFKGIKRIEYRGYDSWGMAVDPGQLLGQVRKLESFKAVGQIGQVKESPLSKGSVAIGHTRWATHGGVTQTNAHPHLSTDGSMAVVHNGVIENHVTLRTFLLENGYRFDSDTDTEVFIKLLEYELKQSNQGFRHAFERTCRQIRGRNAIVVLADGLWIYRLGSPLLFGTDSDYQLQVVSSDLAALAVDATHYAQIPEGKVFHLAADWKADRTADRFTDLIPLVDHLANQSSVYELGEYDHFMQKEIAEQPEVIFSHLESGSLSRWKKLLKMCKGSNTGKQPRKIWTLGSGSAFFAAGQTAWYLRSAGIPAQAIPAYEARSYSLELDPSDIGIVFSQSGETADTNVVVEEWKAKGLSLVGIVNVETSTLANLVDVVFPLQVGSEIGVASTKALTAQISWGWVASYILSTNSPEQVLLDIQQVSQVFQNILTEWLADTEVSRQIDRVVSYLFDYSDTYLLGRDVNYFPVLESALKLKEIAYIHAEGFSGGELKHGVIALIEKGTPVMCFIDSVLMEHAASEVVARGAQVIEVATQQMNTRSLWIRIPDLSQAIAHKNFFTIDTAGFVNLASLFGIIVAQRISYLLAIKKKLNPDKPRNLAKSVTVL